jgi:hypothetical protein
MQTQVRAMATGNSSISMVISRLAAYRVPAAVDGLLQ